MRQNVPKLAFSVSVQQPYMLFGIRSSALFVAFIAAYTCLCASSNPDMPLGLPVDVLELSEAISEQATLMHHSCHQEIYGQGSFSVSLRPLTAASEEAAALHLKRRQAVLNRMIFRNGLFTRHLGQARGTPLHTCDGRTSPPNFLFMLLDRLNQPPV